MNLYANIDGQGHTISNLFSYAAGACGSYSTIYNWSGGFILTSSGSSIKNISFECKKASELISDGYLFAKATYAFLKNGPIAKIEINNKIK